MLALIVYWLLEIVPPPPATAYQLTAYWAEAEAASRPAKIVKAHFIQIFLDVC
jgi:hypothetical protein